VTFAGPDAGARTPNELDGTHAESVGFVWVTFTAEQKPPLLNGVPTEFVPLTDAK
jgi:hypothetical protein